MNHSRRFLIHLGVFLALFVVITGILGPWIVASRLLYGFGFYIYGNLGKMVIYCAIIFLLLTRESLPHLDIPITTRRRYVYLVFALLLIPIFYFLGNSLLSGGGVSTQYPLTILTHTVLVAIPSLLLLTVFGWSFLSRFAVLFRKQLLLCASLAVFFDLAIFQVWKLWPYFSGGVMAGVSWLFSLLPFPVRHIPPRTIFVGSFGVEIAQACSGLDSIFLFTSLYLLIGILDWKKFRLRRYFGIFPLALIGLHIVNILRVFLLILIGVMISPVLAIQLFHTYAGMLLFILYFSLFWTFFYHKLLK